MNFRKPNDEGRTVAAYHDRDRSRAAANIRDTVSIIRMMPWGRKASWRNGGTCEG